jgi:hypothetical protein
VATFVTPAGISLFLLFTHGSRRQLFINRLFFEQRSSRSCWGARARCDVNVGFPNRVVSPR